MKAATATDADSIRAIGISIHAAREGGDFRKLFAFITFTISIHAAREGGDPVAMTHPRLLCISIHAAREGGDILQ